MKIESTLPQVDVQAQRSESLQQSQTAEKDAQGSTAVQKTTAKRDNLNISAMAEKLNQASAESPQAQEFRDDKVAAIKEQLANNSYQVKGQDVAQKMISTMRNGL